MAIRTMRSSSGFLSAPFALATLALGSVTACGLTGDDLFSSGGTASGTAGGASTTTGSGGSTGTGGVATTGTATGGSTGTAGAGGTGGAPSSCGNGLREGAEECDGADFGGKNCKDFGFSKGFGLSCTAACTLDSSTCTPICNGMLEPGEICDGDNLNGHTCAEAGFVNAVGMACANCQLDSSGCAAACNGMLEPGEICDGNNLNGHSCQEFGFASAAGLTCASCQLDPATCTTTCGNATLEPGEACDSPNLNSHTCAEFGFVNPAGLTCTSCQPDPAGCVAACNNGTIEPGEMCDGNKLNGHSCTELMFSKPGGLKCAAGCMGFDSSGCTPTCNDGALEPGEMCDGNNLNGHSCTELMFSNPAGLKCAAGCKGLDSSGCKPTCDGTLEPGEPCDGANLNGHTCAEFGYVNPAGLACAACTLNKAGCVAVCGNGTVEPGEVCDDGNVISGDGCTAACASELLGTSCASAVPVPLSLGSQVINGTTVGGGTHTGTNCVATSAGPDRIFAVTAASAGFLTASLSRAGTSYDSVLYAANACSDGNANTSILCADSYDPNNAASLNGGEVISFRVAQGQVVYLFVDGYIANSAGNFQLTLDLSTGANCADPVPIPIEPGSPMTLLGTTVNAGSDQAGSCSNSSGQNPDVVYQVTRSNNGSLGATLPQGLTNYTSVLYARSSCDAGANELACNNVNGNGGETINLANLVGGTPVFVWVDGSSAGTPSGNYGLRLTP